MKHFINEKLHPYGRVSFVSRDIISPNKKILRRWNPVEEYVVTSTTKTLSDYFNLIKLVNSEIQRVGRQFTG